MAPSKQPAPRSLRSLGEPAPIAVSVDAEGSPCRVDGHAVEAIREEWRVEEAWWTAAPIRRRYLEAVLDTGRLIVLFEDRREPGRWYAHGGGRRTRGR